MMVFVTQKDMDFDGWLLETEYEFYIEPLHPWDDENLVFVTTMIDENWEQYGIGEALWVFCNQQDCYVCLDLE